MTQYLAFPTTLIELLRLRTQNQPIIPAYTFLREGETEENSITYIELEHLARALGAKLQSMISPGERVLLLYPSGLDYIIAFFACIYAGVIAIPAYPPRINRFDLRLQLIIADAQAKVVLTTSDVTDRLTHYIAQSPELENLQWLATDNFLTRENNDGSQYWQEPKVQAKDLAFLQYTSGSTGSPKGVMVSHSNLLHNSAYMASIWKAHANSVMVTWLPIFHDMGLIFGILQPLYQGFPCYLMSPAAFVQQPFRWLQAISRYKATHSAAPNFGYELCVNKVTPEQRDSLDLSHWEMSINGAEPVRAETFTHFYEYFKSAGLQSNVVCHGYGLAEATLAVAAKQKSVPSTCYVVQTDAIEKQHRVIPIIADSSENAHTFIGCGYPASDATIVIADPVTQKQCKPNQIGEIWLSGPSIAYGYWQKSVETTETFQAYLSDNQEGPFLRTGDLGFLREDGELFITGRWKDLIIIHGENFYPQDIEHTVEESHPALHQGHGAAFAVEIEGEERLIVAQEIKRTELKKVDTGEIISTICKAILERYQLAVHTVVLLKPATILKTSSGKIQRQACKKGFLNNTLKTVARWQHPHYETLESQISGEFSDGQASTQQLPHTSPDGCYLDILATVRKTLSTLTGLTHIGEHENLIESGLDSFSSIELQEELAKIYRVSLSNTFLRDHPTLYKISDYLRQQVQPATTEEVEVKAVAEDDMSSHLAELADFSYRFASELKGRRAKIDGQWYIDYGSCNYLGFDWHSDIMAAVSPALEQWGVHPPWTRFLASPQPYQDLESKLAELVDAPYVDVFPTVTLLNMGLMPELIGPQDVLFIDQYAHNCLQKAAALCRERGSRIIVFRHNDTADLERRMCAITQSCKKLIAIDGVYSLDGTYAPLPTLVNLAKQYNAMIMVDDSHGFGVLGEHPSDELPYGKRGNGIVKYYDLDYGRDKIIYVGQLSKSYSTMGGFVAYGDLSIQTAVRHAFSMVFSGPLPTASLATGIAAVEVNEREGDKARAAILERTRALTDGLHQLGYEISSPKDAHNVRVNLGAQPISVEFLKKLMIDERIIVTPAVYPAVEWNNTGFRLMVTALHTEQDIADTLVSMEKLVYLIRG